MSSPSRTAVTRARSADCAKDVARRRIRQRGFGHVAFTLEAAAVLGWFAILVLGEKLVSDATTARRAVEVSAEQSAIASATTYCEDSVTTAPPIGAYQPQASTGISPHGKPDVGSLPSIVAGLGFGAGQPTFSLYTQTFQVAKARATQGGVKGAPQIGSTEHTFQGQRAFACLERSKDAAATSIAKYRASVFDLNIKGF